MEEKGNILTAFYIFENSAIWSWTSYFIVKQTQIPQPLKSYLYL